MTDHAGQAASTWDRQALNDELFRRPPVPIPPRALVVHTAFLQDDDQAARSVARLRGLLTSAKLERPTEDRNYELIEFGDNLLKWERHTEFTSYTLVAGFSDSDPFVAEVGPGLPAQWMAELEGQQIAATKLCIASPSEASVIEAATRALKPAATSGLVSEGQARIWMDCSIHDDGCTRAIVEDRGMPADRRARDVQRLLEVDTYRMTAMLGFPPARTVMGELHTLESNLRELVERVAATDAHAGATDDESTLHELLELAADIERLSANNAYRFEASRAYFHIVEDRLNELGEERIEGHQRLSHFLRRRLGPAQQTIDAVGRRLETLSGHINHTASLIRTRLDVDTQEQSQRLLHSMDRRAGLQLRLQQTLEWLTIAAMSYYGIGVVLYIAEAVEAVGAAVNPRIVAGLAAPVVMGGAYWIVHRIRQILREADV